MLPEGFKRMSKKFSSSPQPVFSAQKSPSQTKPDVQCKEKTQHVARQGSLMRGLPLHTLSLTCNLGNNFIKIGLKKGMGSPPHFNMLPQLIYEREMIMNGNI